LMDCALPRLRFIEFGPIDVTSPDKSHPIVLQMPASVMSRLDR
jgi:hypothetical protein